MIISGKQTEIVKVIKTKLNNTQNIRVLANVRNFVVFMASLVKQIHSRSGSQYSRSPFITLVHTGKS